MGSREEVLRIVGTACLTVPLEYALDTWQQRNWCKYGAYGRELQNATVVDTSNDLTDFKGGRDHII